MSGCRSVNACLYLTINNEAIYYAMLDGRMSVFQAAVICHQRMPSQCSEWHGLLLLQYRIIIYKDLPLLISLANARRHEWYIYLFMRGMWDKLNIIYVKNWRLYSVKPFEIQISSHFNFKTTLCICHYLLTIEILLQNSVLAVSAITGWR